PGFSRVPIFMDQAPSRRFAEVSRITRPRARGRTTAAQSKRSVPPLVTDFLCSYLLTSFHSPAVQGCEPRNLAQSHADRAPSTRHLRCGLVSPDLEARRSAAPCQH